MTRIRGRHGVNGRDREMDEKMRQEIALHQ